MVDWLSTSLELTKARPCFAMQAGASLTLRTAHGVLGGILCGNGEHGDALVEFRVAHEIGSKQPDWPDPTDVMIKKTEPHSRDREAARGRREGWRKAERPGGGG